MILGIIPARGGSKGLPGKNIRPLAGLPLVAHSIRAARASGALCDVMVSTDDPAIAEVARREGVDVPRLRPAELATDEIAWWPAVRDCVGQWEAAKTQTLEGVAVLQPTSPLRTAADIDGCIARFREVQADVCVTVFRPHDSPYFNMVEPVRGSVWARPSTAVMRQLVRRQDTPDVFALNGAVYVARRTVLDTIANQFDVERYAIHEMPRSRSVDIDTIEDFELAEWWLARA